MKKLTVGILASSLIFLGGCLKQKTDNSNPIVKVNGHVITENAFNETLEQSYNLSGQGENKPDLKDTKSKFIYLVHKNRVISDLIIRQLIEQEAEKRQLKVEDNEIDSEIDNIAKSMGGKERFKASLALNKLDEDSFRENLKLDLLKKKLVTNIIGDDKISEEEIKKFYEENKEEKFKHDKEVRASHILIGASEADIKNRIRSEADEKLSEEELGKKVNQEVKTAEKKAQELYKELKANPDKFTDYAKQYSEDPSSASKGGDLGFFSKEEMVPEFAEAAFSTKPGELSAPVKTEFGYHIIKVLDRKEEGVTPFNEIKPHIERYLEGKEKMDAFRKLIEDARKSAEIVYVEKEYDPDNIKKEYRELIEELRQEQQAESAESKTEQKEEKAAESK